MIAGEGFAKLCDVSPELDESGAVLAVYPQDRYENAGERKLHRYGSGPFCKFRLQGLPSKPGVYAYIINGKLRYIGRTQLARQTLYAYSNIAPRMCYKGGQERSCRINNLIHDAVVSGAEIELWFKPTEDYVLVESDLISRFRPDWNLT